MIQEFGDATTFYVRGSDSLSEMPIRPTAFKRVVVSLDDFALLEQPEFVLNHAVCIEETRHFEFKEVKSSTGAVENIVNASDEYAVAFLNSEGGRIFCGIRDKDRVVVGVRLDYGQRDKLRRDVSAKINQIEPSVDPSRYRIEIHPVRDEHGTDVPDLCVVELVVPGGASDEPYYTGGGEA